MRCETCQGIGKVTYDQHPEPKTRPFGSVFPCPECAGSGITHGCDGLTACNDIPGPSFEPELRPDLPDGATLPNGMKNQTTSAAKFMGKSVIWGKDGEHATAYMTRYWIGRLRLHVFHRGDQDPDAHDHPWGFWTFPFTSYVEEVVERDEDGHYKRFQIVPAWRLNYRPATHTHRVLGRYGGFDVMGVPVIVTAPIVTLVWRGKDERKWGFLKHRDGKWCWVHWKSYVFGGGKSAPCE